MGVSRFMFLFFIKKKEDSIKAINATGFFPYIKQVGRSCVFLIPIGFDSVYPQDEESINLRTKHHLESPPNPAVAMETASII